MSYRERLKLTVLTGFLGSGKTTLLRRTLGPGRRRDVVVIVNEFGAHGIDHEVIGDSCACCLLVAGGCACCERRYDLLATLGRLLDDHQRDRMPGLRHVVVETSGLSDPLPIVTAITLDPVLRHHFELNGIVAVVDAVEGAEQIDQYPEITRQVLSSDCVVISKTDLAAPELVEGLRNKLSILNPTATIAPASEAWQDLLEAPRRVADRPLPDATRVAMPIEHTENLTCASLTLDEPLDWVAFGVWLSLLVHAHGRRLLRVKGIVPTAGIGPISINAVQHAIYPPEHVGSARAGEPARLVVIAQELSPDSLMRSLWAFQRAA